MKFINVLGQEIWLAVQSQQISDFTRPSQGLAHRVIPLPTFLVAVPFATFSAL